MWVSNGCHLAGVAAERFGDPGVPPMASPWGPQQKDGPARSALKVRDDAGTGPITFGSGRMGSKDPPDISCRMAQACANVKPAHWGAWSRLRTPFLNSGDSYFTPNQPVANL